ncbi:general secretion pathway protein GspK [Stakelama saccharophila]|uniref:Type II secretion system protein K n=1 Tax=Stakelama saccharophila TaxID=3075605 RepID=A0ABZ0BBX9_9SPHN|nr:type II secretion system protein GspK [Stakelama sp. W311]WNO54798.1 type II secretion system protein GspK [Stakelama sp. W311]
MRAAVRDDEKGMILVNVLLFVAIASGMVMLMINREELALDRAIRAREAAQALSVVRGGEVSAIVALRRDAIEAPESDHAAEPWAALAESGAPIRGGTFDMAIADAQGRYNINNVMSPQLSDRIMFRSIAQAAGLSDEQIAGAVALVREYGPITDLRPIRLSGIEPERAARLEALVTALPGHTDININAAPPAVLTVLFRDPSVVDRLLALRRRQGFIARADLSDMNQTVPAGAGFTSDNFWVRTAATIGGTRQEEAALVQRIREDKRIRVATVERWRNSAVPPEVPPFASPAS